MKLLVSKKNERMIKQKEKKKKDMGFRSSYLPSTTPPPYSLLKRTPRFAYWTPPHVLIPYSVP